jgi:hypothetical protein
VKSVLAVKQNGMREDVVWMEDHMERIPKSPRHKIVPESIFSSNKTVRRQGFFDVAITSPPYLNNITIRVTLDPRCRS